RRVSRCFWTWRSRTRSARSIRSRRWPARARWRCGSLSWASIRRRGRAAPAGWRWERREMAHLPVDPNAPLLIRAAADAVLWTHIGGGSAGIASGFVAVLARKGGWWHRKAGTVFFGSMLLMAGVGA